MNFNAKQMKEEALLKEGRYKFRVLDAREKRSSAGNDMLNLKLALAINQREVTYFTTIVLTPKMFWLLEHFCEATKMPEKIEEGRLMAQDCFDKEGYIDIIVKQNKDTGELENQTKDFVKPEKLEPEPVDLNDDIPDFTK